MKLLSTLQVYRALAALLVVSYHARNTIAYFTKADFVFLSRFGTAGVLFFFVLSGFVMFWVHERDFGKPGRAGNYFRKRALRIYPVYWVVTLTLLPFWLLVPGFGRPYHKELAPLVKSLLLFPQSHLPHLIPAWTLTHEVLFYLVFAVLLFSRRAGLVLIAAWALATAWIWAIGANENFPADYLWGAVNLLFPLGMAAAFAARRLSFLRGWGGFYLFAAGNLLFALGLFLPDVLFQRVDFVLVFGPASFLILAGATGGAVDGFFEKQRLLLFLGAASYSIYLAHEPVMSVTGKILYATGLWRKMPPLAGLFVFILAGVAGGILLHRFVERPLLAIWGKRSERGKKKPPS